MTAVLVIAWPVAEMSWPAPALVWQAPSSGAAASKTRSVRPIDRFVRMVMNLLIVSAR